MRLCPKSALLLGATLCLSPCAQAEQTSAIAPVSAPTQMVTTQARLDFGVVIDKFLYLRIGTGSSFAGNTLLGTRPATSPAVDSMQFALSTTIPSAATTPVPGNNLSTQWNKTAPSFTVLASGNVIGIELACNAGQVGLSAQVTTPLSNGASTLPASAITIASSSVALPGPTIPNTGTGPTANVATGGAGTAAAPSLLSYQTANWTFSYTPTATTMAGTYNGQITFTATSL